MRARDREVAGADSALARGVVGIGDGPREKDAAMVRRLADLPDGTLVWTRAGDGSYRLGRVDGPYRRDDSAAGRTTGIVHVRPATWLERRFGENEVPPRVAYAFARGGRNLQAIRDDRAAEVTAALWRAHER